LYQNDGSVGIPWTAASLGTD
jgi:hypothetical protein